MATCLICSCLFQVADEKAALAKRLAMMKELLAGAGGRPPLLVSEFPCKFNCGKTCATFLELVQHHENCGKSAGLPAAAPAGDAASAEMDDDNMSSDGEDILNHSNASVGSSLNGGGLLLEHHSDSRNSKQTRVRTLISEEQLGVLKTFYMLNPRPKREELEAIASKIGHPFKVVKVWFQNSRARDRREGKPTTTTTPNNQGPHQGGGFNPLGLQLLNNNITGSSSSLQDSLGQLQGLFPRIPQLGGPGLPHQGAGSSGGAGSNSSEDPKSPCSSTASMTEVEDEKADP